MLLRIGFAVAWLLVIGNMLATAWLLWFTPLWSLPILVSLCAWVAFEAGRASS